MLADNLDAIRALLKSTFPSVSRIYINSVPTGFIRPSFFVELISGDDEDLNKAYYSSTATWQIVYFAPLTNAGDTDTFDQLQVSDTLKGKLMESSALTSPSGKVYHILECSGGPRDAEVYITIRLQIEKRRAEQQYDYMEDVQSIIN